MPKITLTYTGDFNPSLPMRNGILNIVDEKDGVGETLNILVGHYSGRAPWPGHTGRSYSITIMDAYGNHSTPFQYHDSNEARLQGRCTDLAVALQAIASDAMSYKEHEKDFEGFAKEFGYDDRGQAMRVYSACKKTYWDLVAIGMGGEEEFMMLMMEEFEVIGTPNGEDE